MVGRIPATFAAVLSDALRATLRQEQASLANFASVRHVEDRLRAAKVLLEFDDLC